MKRKHYLILSGAGLLAVVAALATAVAVQTLRSDDVDLEESAPAIPRQDASAAASQGAPSDQAGVLRFVVDASGSKATYVVREKLAALPVESNAVGETGQISGEIYLTSDGLHPGQKSTFRVDLRTLRSDESRRDNFIRSNTLRANQFPFAEFVVESVNGWPSNYVDGTEVVLQVSGSMTIKGITRPLTFDVKARRQGDTLTAIADAEFKMTDFGITPPDVALAKAQDGVRLQVVLLAKQPAT